MKRFLMLKALLFVVGLLLSIGTFAQQMTVKGHVKDATGEPVIGANVLIKGTTSGVITDFDGNFVLQAKQGDVVVISFVGYQAQELPVQPVLNVVLKDDSQLLQDVVVIGYGTVKKNDLTGSTLAIDADKMVKGAATSATDLLVGKAAGVSVITNGGAPGAGATIRVRGGSSMSASNDPLIVIDGVPVDNGGIDGMSNPLATIHPNDIETFTILKDASSTAIYGSRASNGVIIITTKKGKSGKVKVNYSGTFSVSTKTKTVDVMGADNFRSFVEEKFGKESNQYAALGKSSTDWQKEIFRTALSTDHNVSVAGAIPHMPYRVSLAYTNENGILKTSNLQRWTGAVSLNPNFFEKKLNIQLNVKGVYNTNRFADTGSIGIATQFDPTQPVYMEGSDFGNGYYMALDKSKAPIGIALANPVAMLEQKHDESTVYRSIGNAQIDYRMHFLPELRANLNLGYDVSKGEGDVIIEDNSPMTWVTGNYKQGWGENSHYYQLKRNLLLDFYLNYAKEFGKHNLDVMAGYSWQHFYNSTSRSYPYSEAMAKKKNASEYKEPDSYETENYLVSFFGRLNYSLMNRYLLTFTLRNDGSSRFNKDNRWGLFPSVALAWKMNEEGFMKDVRAISDLKLRLGYGITGQQNLGSGDYPYLPRYMASKAGASYFFGDKKYSLLVPLAFDANLKWEETTTYNVGIDYGFLNGRITGALDLYYRKTEDLLNTVAVAAGTNFNNQLLTNVGTLENKGIEFSINAHAITSKDWNWNLGYNISYNKNKITKMTINDDPNYVGVIHGGIDGATGTNVMINAVNNPYNSFYVFEQIYDQNGKPIEGAYVDHNGDGKVGEKENDGDLIAYKKSAPDVFMGLTSQLSYKNWDLSFAMRASIGNYVYNNVQSNREAWGGSEMYDNTGFLKNRINSAGDTNFKEPRRRSSYYVQNASFLRMDNISLGYTFNKLFNEKQTARVYATVQNPFVITKYSGLDPEISGEGIDNNIYPRPRVFMIGLNLNF
ncbi:SusC/RagA family TonB-linked outer membrane protein [Bacteroides pyogenes]|uniref:SusC/RagA family TonB-linked outer membrane protein n=1 Tax=Bacteroides pyogenes TaxID=310300 RepID=UPI003B4284C2